MLCQAMNFYYPATSHLGVSLSLKFIASLTWPFPSLLTSGLEEGPPHGAHFSKFRSAMDAGILEGLIQPWNIDLLMQGSGEIFC